MAIRTFNISDDVYIPFAKLHKGKMSKIIEDMIKSYLGYSDSSVELQDIQAQIDETRHEIQERTAQVHKLQLVYEQKIKQNQEANTQSLQEKRDCDQWVKETIDFYVNHSPSDYANIKLEASRLGISIEKHLQNKYYEEKKRK